MKREFQQSFFRFFVLPILFLFLATFGLTSLSPAQATNFSVIDSWVEEGYEFHVRLVAPPSNAMCPIHGEGLIAFEVAYFTPASSEEESVFGVTTWYPASNPNGRVETHGAINGPIGLCTNASPCRIRWVRVVKTYCPPNEGALYPPGWYE